MRQKKAQRFKYLEALYKLVNGSPLNTAEHSEILARAGLKETCGKDAFYYLLNDGLITVQHLSEKVKITHRGVKAYEASLEDSQEQLNQNPSGTTINNIINAKEVSESVISFGDQTFTQERDLRLEEVAEFIRLLRAKMPDLTVAEETQNLILSEVKTIEEQLKSPQPQKKLITAALQSLKRTLSNSFLDTGVRFLLAHLKRLN